MPSNKNAVVRYKYLDDMLSDTHRSYTCTEMWERCNERLRMDGYPEVTKRTIENDLNDLEGSPFFKEIDRGERKGGKTVLHYRDHSQPLFGKELSDDEKSLLSEILNALGKFSGLESFHWLDDIQERLNDRQRALTTHGTDAGRLRPVISFSTNPYLKHSSHLGGLLSAISARTVLDVHYRKFCASKPTVLRVSPYLLKQYNDRWYLIGTPSGDDTNPYSPDFLVNLPLDRIESYECRPEALFHECQVDLEAHFDDIVGVTYEKGKSLETILFAISPESVNYIRTKPMHSSQIELPSSEQLRLHEKYPSLGRHVFFTLECVLNYELVSLLRGYGKNVVVLGPDSLRTEFVNDLLSQMKNYGL